MNYKYFKKICLVIVPIFVLFNLSCQKKVEDTSLKIGAIIPLTGSLAFMGELEKNGIKIVNSSQEDIEVFFEDSEGKASKGLNTAQNLLNTRGVDILLTTGTAVSRSVASLHSRYKFLQSAFCMDPTIHIENENILRLYYGMEEESQVIIDYLYNFSKSQNLTDDLNIGILSVNHQGTIQQINDYFLPEFKKLGLKVDFIDTYEFTQKDFKNIMSKIKQSKINNLIIIGYGFVYPQIFKNLEQYNLKDNINIIGGWGFIANKNLSNEQLDNVIVASPKCMVLPNKDYLEFEEEYLKKFNTYPNFESALAYENIRLFNKAIITTKSTKLDKIKKYLIKNNFDSILGEISIDKEGKINIPIVLAKFKNGELMSIEE